MIKKENAEELSVLFARIPKALALKLSKMSQKNGLSKNQMVIMALKDLLLRASKTSDIYYG